GGCTGSWLTNRITTSTSTRNVPKKTSNSSRNRPTGFRITHRRSTSLGSCTMSMKSVPRVILACALATLPAPAARADVKLHPLFTDHMVPQRDLSIPVWGPADPGEEVTVRLRSDAEARATADKDGRWTAKLPRQQAGGPYELTVTGKNTVTLKDVLVGEVWVCSGQSNMEWTLKKCDQFGADAIANAQNSQIRL